MTLVIFNPEKAREAGAFSVYKKWAEGQGVDLFSPVEHRGYSMGYMQVWAKNKVNRDMPYLVEENFFDPYIENINLEDFM